MTAGRCTRCRPIPLSNSLASELQTRVIAPFTPAEGYRSSLAFLFPLGGVRNAWAVHRARGARYIDTQSAYLAARA